MLPLMLIFFFLIPFINGQIQLQKCTFRPITMKNVTLNGGSFISPPLWSSFCDDSARNISSRISFPEYINCTSTDDWGPQPNNYPLEEIPTLCDSTLWLQTRVLRAAQHVISLNINYCHHHTPGWLPPDTSFFRQIISSDTGVCHDRGENSTNQWVGIDCSTYTSFIYNFGLGVHLTKDVKKQACSSDAPGRILNISNLTLINKLEILKPGDLLYLDGGTNSDTITHVIMWTGYKLTNDNGPFGIQTLVNVYPAEQRGWILWEAAKSFKSNYPIYLITDSSGSGPNYRLFLGWYRLNFRYARRLINPRDNLLPDCF